MQITTLCQPSILLVPQIIHQAYIFDTVMRIGSWRDMAVQKAGLRPSRVSMEVGEHRICGRPC